MSGRWEFWHFSGWEHPHLNLPSSRGKRGDWIPASAGVTRVALGMTGDARPFDRLRVSGGWRLRVSGGWRSRMSGRGDGQPQGLPLRGGVEGDGLPLSREQEGDAGMAGVAMERDSSSRSLLRMTWWVGTPPSLRQAQDRLNLSSVEGEEGEHRGMNGCGDSGLFAGAGAEFREVYDG